MATIPAIALLQIELTDGTTVQPGEAFACPAVDFDTFVAMKAAKSAKVAKAKPTAPASPKGTSGDTETPAAAPDPGAADDEIV